MQNLQKFAALSLLLCSGQLPADSIGGPFLDAYGRAQPVIRATVEAYGGADRINAIDSVYLRQEGLGYLRQQSPTLETITQPTWLVVAYDRGDAALMVENGGPLGANRTITRGETTEALDPQRRVHSAADQLDVATHYVHRIVPALLARKLYERARNVIWIGESEVDGRAADALAIAWDDGNSYVVHVDRGSRLIVRYDILAPDPLLGDGVFESTFADYRSVDGIPMPMRRSQQVGGEMTFDMRTTEVRFDADVAEHFEVPDGYRRVARAPDPDTALREIAAGVYLGNGNYQNLFIVLDEYIIAVDAGGDVAGDVERVRTVAPGKPIRYAVLTHHHTDHSGGVASYVAEGAEIVTRRSNEALVRRIVADGNSRAANAPQPPAGEPRFLFVERRQVIENGGRRIEIHHMPNEHAEDYLVVYLPEERILYGADVFSLPASGPPPKSNSQFESFYRHLEQRRLRPYTVLNAHGPIGTIHDLHAWAENR